MKTQVKLQYLSAFMMLVFGMVLCALGFAADPYGEVSNSVIGIFGQSLTSNLSPLTFFVSI